jgi:hypothetical protein
LNRYPSNTALSLLLVGLSGCSHSQTAPTPVAGSTSTVSATNLGSKTGSKTASKTQKPWTNAASNPSPQPVGDLTAPIDVALVLCTHALNLSPCGLITTGVNDVMVCLSGCQTQIETVVAATIERAAETCAHAPPPEAGPRECTLSFPPTAALDIEVVGHTCNTLCEEIAERVARAE